MTEDVNEDLPGWFKLVAGLAVAWNLLGVVAYIAQTMMTPEAFAAMSPAEQDLYTSTPAWATGAFAIAVFGGAAGSLLLFLRKALAESILVLSLAGVVVQMFHSFFMSNAFEVYGPGGAIMPVLVLLIAIALVWLARSAKTKGWIT